jgi:hypothetical protein
MQIPGHATKFATKFPTIFNLEYTKRKNQDMQIPFNLQITNSDADFQSQTSRMQRFGLPEYNFGIDQSSQKQTSWLQELHYIL